MLSPSDVVSRDREIRRGAPAFRGTRVRFQVFVDYLEGVPTLDEFLDDFPTANREAAVPAVEPAKALLVGERG